MTRSEEELRVGTAERETGRVRLRKYIVTDEVQQTVPVKREEVRLEREPITDANRDEAMSGGDLTEEEHEVTLHTEEPVVEKRTVPRNASGSARTSRSRSAPCRRMCVARRSTSTTPRLATGSRRIASGWPHRRRLRLSAVREFVSR